jgi:hypothetical protein
VKIYTWPYYLEVQGKVWRSDPNLGVFVAFGQIESRYVSVLNACLLEAKQKQPNRTVDLESSYERRSQITAKKCYANKSNRGRQF